MTRGALDDAQRIASFYAAGFARDREARKSAHNESMVCRDVEDRLTFLNSLLRNVLGVESRMRTESSLDQTLRGEEMEQLSLTNLQNISKDCARVKEIIDWFETQGYKVDGAPEFQSLWTAIGVLVRISQLPANPRPVCVDGHGNIFEITGESVSIPGVTPDMVLEGLEDSAAGKYRPLTDVIADRRNEISGKSLGES